MAINFKNSMADPYAVDIGNKTIQGLTVSKTLQFGLFTTNENAVWAARIQLQKESFPFAVISITVNRDMFRLQVGDCFKFSYSKYSISDMICRVLQIEEDSLKSENITLHCIEDVFSVTNMITEYSDPTDNRGVPLDYTITPIVYQDVIETPYVLTEDVIGIIPLVARSDSNQTGYVLYMSQDDGDSYNSIGSFQTFAAYGTLVSEYTTDTYQIDDVGFTVDFVNSDIDFFENLTRQDLIGRKNLAIVGTEIMTIQTITPDGAIDDRYHLSGVYRGRLDTEKENHSADAGFWLVNGEFLEFSTDSGLLPGTTRKFKVVPYNIRQTGAIADSLVTTLTIESRSRKPYIPINLKANGDAVDPEYTANIVLTWSPRLFEGGAGANAPNVTDKAVTWDGLFEVEVYVSSSLVRTATAINDDTWTYTSAMNTTDNGSLAAEVTFKLMNYIEYDAWENGESAQREIIVEKTT